EYEAGAGAESANRPPHWQPEKPLEKRKTGRFPCPAAIHAESAGFFQFRPFSSRQRRKAANCSFLLNPLREGSSSRKTAKSCFCSAFASLTSASSPAGGTAGAAVSLRARRATFPES